MMAVAVDAWLLKIEVVLLKNAREKNRNFLAVNSIYIGGCLTKYL